MKLLLEGCLLVYESLQISADSLFLFCALGANLLEGLARMLSGLICFPCRLTAMGINKCLEVCLASLRSRELAAKPNEFLGESGNLSPGFLVLLFPNRESPL